MPENLKAVMQSEGFGYMKESYPSVLAELLQYVAKISEHSVVDFGRQSNVAFAAAAPPHEEPSTNDVQIENQTGKLPANRKKLSKDKGRKKKGSRVKGEAS